MEFKNYFKYFFWLVLGTILFYILFANQYNAILQSLNISFAMSGTNIDLFSLNISIINGTNDSISELSLVTKKFESHLSDYYPHLPIHIFTQNFSLIRNTTKLILLGNGFFGDKNWEFLSPSFTSSQIMTLLQCPFLSNHCDITTNFSRFSEADAIVYHMRDGVDKNAAKEKRHPKQRFVFALWESPAHSPDLRSYAKFFNWTMSYRFKSHIITSYYSGHAYVHTSSDYYQTMLHENSTRKLNLKAKIPNYRPSDEALQRKKLGIAAALISNCGGTSNRLAFIKELQQYIDVKVYGRCGESCPPNANCREFIAQNYYFILSFENSLCSDYTTEKFFAAIEHPVVPVVLGRTNYSYFIPPSGYIDTKHFSTMISLAQYLNTTRYDKEKYLSYFSWKKDYIWGIGHFFTPFCDLCLRLHLDSKPNIIDDMQKWWYDDACETARIPK